MNEFIFKYVRVNGNQCVHKILIKLNELIIADIHLQYAYMIQGLRFSTVMINGVTSGGTNTDMHVHMKVKSLEVKNYLASDTPITLV